MKVNCVRCKKCGEIIYSRAVHDMHWCSCGAVAVDGGFDYFKVATMAGVSIDDVEILSLSLNVTKKELYDDWDKGIDLYGKLDRNKKN